MKTSSPALGTLLASGSFLITDLYTLTLANGSAFYFSAGDADVLWEGNRYSCGGMTGPYFGKDGQRSTLHQKLGAGVDAFYVQLLPGQSTIMGLPWGEARRVGVFQGAWMRYDRAYFSWPLTGLTWPLVPVGVLNRFLGKVGATDGGGGDMVFSVNSPMKLLVPPLPRQLYQPNCRNIFGDSRCGINIAALTVTALALAGSTALTINATLAEATGTFNNGVVAFTSGALNGFSRTIETFVSGGVIAMATPFPEAPAAGDSFTVIPGCDKTFNGPLGCPLWNNLNHFNGEPFVPLPNTVQ